MKVIDLLNKIANGEIKDKTIFRINWGHIYRDFYYDSNEENQLQCLKNCSDDYSLYDDIKLNDEIEVIEDTPKENKKIEKLKVYDNAIEWCCNGRAINDIEKDIIDKLNEIIDHLNVEK